MNVYVRNSQSSAVKPMPFLPPLLTPSMPSQAEARPVVRLTAEQMETIIVKAEEWARHERMVKTAARLRALNVKGGGVFVPADWREQPLNCAGDA